MVLVRSKIHGDLAYETTQRISIMGAAANTKFHTTAEESPVPPEEF
jgi:hypothetical protein